MRMAPSKLPEDDPVSAEYDVYITPALAEQLHLLQFPMRDRTQPYLTSVDDTDSPAVNMRMKPRSGFVEMDVPAQNTLNYDERKANNWGAALGKVRAEGASGFGIAVGFAPSVGVRAQRDKATKDAVPQPREESEAMAAASMSYQTLGGQTNTQEEDSPFLMLGVFREDQLHLTRVDVSTSMRPQFHHIDAKVQEDRNKMRRERETTENVRPAEARSVQMTLKPAEGERSDHTRAHTHAHAARQEAWRRLHFFHEETGQAYDAYHEKLCVQDPNLLNTELHTSIQDQQYLDSVTPVRHGDRGSKAKITSRRNKNAADTGGAGEAAEVGDEDVRMVDGSG